jgi:hypothetical protein
MEGGGEGGKVRKMQKKLEKGDPHGFLTIPSTPLQRIWPKPQGQPPPTLDFQLLCIYYDTVFNVLSVSGIKTFHSHDTEL